MIACNTDMPAAVPSNPELQHACYQALFERSSVALLIVASDTLRVLAANEAAGHCFDYPVERMLELNLDVLFHPDDRLSIQHALQFNKQQLEPIHCRTFRSMGEADLVEMEVSKLECNGTHVCMLFIHELKQLRPPIPHSNATIQPPLVDIEDGFLQLDQKARFTFVNAKAEKLLHRRGEDLLGQVIWESIPEALQTDHHFHFTMALQGHWPSSYDVIYPDCQVRHQVRVYPSSNGISVVFRDVTQHHIELERLNQEQARLNAIVNASHEAIISTDAHGLIQIFSPSAGRIFGVPHEAMLGKSVEMLLPERFRAAHTNMREEFARTQCTSGRMMGLRRVKGLRSDGVEIDLEGTIANVLIQGHPVLITTLRDVTHNLIAEAEQQVMRKRLSHLTHRLMLQEKDLIRRISLALHDQLGQTLAAVRIVHETIAALRSQGNSVEQSRLFGQLGTLIEQSIREVRVVLADLQPPMLGENGLAAALDNELRNRAGSQKDMQMVLQAPPEVAGIRWPAAVEHAVFMIAREAVENAIRHSGANLLKLSLAGSPADLTMEVWDNGCGYPANAEATAGHLGLAGMHERANSIGAHITLNSGDKGGAHLSLHWENAE
ncbi:hypothetical protein DIC66_21285 [Rhodoferax lacus]|uniref:histidine kinase n=2 Tax=Rhodoferax lacus TaxID=2184758 RepID=A0A3E1R835_9BURK|nr:hypothetical protein DIC66_21285 [Rhodoferax lacus]